MGKGVDEPPVIVSAARADLFGCRSRAQDRDTAGGSGGVSPIPVTGGRSVHPNPPVRPSRGMTHGSPGTDSTRDSPKVCRVARWRSAGIRPPDHPCRSRRSPGPCTGHAPSSLPAGRALRHPGASTEFRLAPRVARRRGSEAAPRGTRRGSATRPVWGERGRNLRPGGRGVNAGRQAVVDPSRIAELTSLIRTPAGRNPAGSDAVRVTARGMSPRG